MKKVICLLIFIYSIIFLLGCGNFRRINNDSYLRMHIRANSNYAIDQNVKYLVKDEVLKFLTPIVANCNSFEDVKNTLTVNLPKIEERADAVLSENGFNYSSKAYINNEFFPTRYYEDVVLQANFYDALIIELGEGEGDNWWCVVYPPLCFLNAQNTGDNFIYKSKLLELVDKFFKN